MKYHTIVREQIFLNERIPDNLHPVFDLRKISDNPHNRTAGFCFLDDPDNGFRQYTTAYGQWLLSDPQRAEEFTYVHEGKLIWRTEPSFRLMQAFDGANDRLVLRAVFGAGGSGRATEVAAQSLRNRFGCPIRSLQFLYRNLSLVGILDKKSQKRLKDQFVPHAPPTSVSKDIVDNLAVYRSFQTGLAGDLLGADDARRFHESLWRVSAGISHPQTSAACGRRHGRISRHPPHDDEISQDSVHLFQQARRPTCL
ncbi:hypothetical protein B0H19DRAFT_478482 [Mycena capillaripes]|nr:hypothetical protein B0H19DRAFT_478482 [Mycena capillaripes]